jgi:nicotinamidase-related amidase
MSSFTLQPTQTVLLIVDMQEKIFASVDRGPEILQTLCKLVKGFQILHLPILLSEQYPQGLGQTVEPLKSLLGEAYRPWIKSTFSCLDHADFFKYMLSLPYQQWIVVGIEAHICLLQTVKGLLSVDKQVTVLNDAITSRSIYDFSTAIAEMRDAGARISCTETVLFELLKDSQHPHFKSISSLIKTQCGSCTYAS